MIALLEMVCITYQYMICMHAIYVLILYIHPIIMHVYNLYICNNLDDCSIRNGMYYIPVYGMYACYICTDIIHSSYYNACI